MKKIVRRIFATAFFVESMLFLACAPEPFYDENIGVPGVAVEAGSLAGTWAFHYRYTSLGYVLFLAQEVEAVRDEYFLLHRAWNPDSMRYTEQWTICGDANSETAGLRVETSAATLRGANIVDGQPQVDHERGAYHLADALQLWALHNLPDPLLTPLPTPENYQEAPYSHWIWDSDADGNIGCTSYLHGLIEGEGYYIRRAVNDFRGPVLNADYIFGLVRQHSSWAILESTVPFTVQAGRVPSDDNHSHPNPKRSWFEQIRMPDNANCSDVIKARDTKGLSVLRPF